MFAYKDKNTGNWDNQGKRLAPPEATGLFESTLVHTLILLGASPEEVDDITKQSAGKGKNQGKSRGKGKGAKHGKGKR